MFKKIIKNITLSFIVLWWAFSFCFWLWNIQDHWDYGELESTFPWEDSDIGRLSCDWSTNLWDCTSVKEDKYGWNETIIRRLLWVFGLDTSTERDLKFIDYARAILNIALWLIAFIALIMTIYTFYMMLFSENEAWIKKAKESLVGIFIALGIIWLAWIIVSFIFWWYKSNWKAQEEKIWTLNIDWEMTMIIEKSTNNIYLTI